jgi:hypothetical protein
MASDRRDPRWASLRSAPTCKSAAIAELQVGLIPDLFREKPDMFGSSPTIVGSMASDSHNPRWASLRSAPACKSAVIAEL